MTALKVNAHANPIAKPQPSRRTADAIPTSRPAWARPRRRGSGARSCDIPGGTLAGRPPEVTTSNGHQDAIRGMNGGNCAYIAQSNGASSEENGGPESRPAEVDRDVDDGSIDTSPPKRRRFRRYRRQGPDLCRQDHPIPPGRLCGLRASGSNRNYESHHERTEAPERAQHDQHADNVTPSG